MIILIMIKHFRQKNSYLKRNVIINNKIKIICNKKYNKNICLVWVTVKKI